MDSSELQSPSSSMVLKDSIMSRKRFFAYLGIGVSIGVFASEYFWNANHLVPETFGDERVNTSPEITSEREKQMNEKTQHDYARPSEEEIKKRLTPIQYKVTQEDDTERPFSNDYWDNKSDGIYVDVVSGEPLFSSKDKFDSGTGWPSFVRPLVAENLTEKTDWKLFMARTEVRSKHANSHLGHVFNDGPKPTGLRYCMNSASMRFVPVDQLKSQGYGEFSKLFNSEPQK